MNVAVDTDVVSYIFKQDTRAPFYQVHLLGLSAALSFMSVAELDNWALRQGWGQAKTSQTRSACRLLHDYPARPRSVSLVGRGDHCV